VRPARRAAAALLLVGAALAGCTAGDGTAPVPAPAPAPPAACLLDVTALAAATGLAWTADGSTASDTRCVYDPAGGTAREFLAVDVAPLGGAGAGAELAALAEVCGTPPVPVAADGPAMVCTLESGSVYAATAGGSRLVTIAASAVPAGTTAERLTVALAEQLALVG
jgi:hypothetical protein